MIIRSTKGSKVNERVKKGRKFNLDRLDYYDLEEILLAVKYQFGLRTEKDAKDNIENGEYSREDILKAIAYYRTDGLGTHKMRMDFLPTELKSVEKDYAKKLKLREYEELNESMTTISSKIKGEILKMFRTTNNDVLDSYTKSNEFVVECDNSNATYVGWLLEKLVTLEGKYDIGVERESNGNGFYGYTYTFYKYLNESSNLDESLRMIGERDMIIRNNESVRLKGHLLESKLKTFTRRDYMGYQGANRLPSGAEPKIYYGDTADVLVSGDSDNKSMVGVSIVTGDHEYLLEFDDDEYGALKRAEDIIRDLDKGSLDVSDIAKKYRMKKLF